MRALEQKLAAKDEELQVILRENMEQKHYIFTLSNRLSAAEFECEQIRDSAKKAAEYSSDVLMQRDLRYENSVLKGQLERMTRQRQVIAQVDTNSLKPSDRTIWQEFELIATDLKDACSSVEITVPTSSPTTNGETDSWAQRVAHCTFSQLLTGAIDTDVSEFHLVRALAAAGISDLVFESSFPDFLARESPILDQYRNHILAKAGPQTLYQLDVLACKSVMSEAYYQTHILQASAKTLSTKFSSALAHLLSPNDQTTAGAEPDGLFPSHCSSGSSSSSHHTEENPVAKVFNEAFARALTLKQDLVVLSRSTYKLVFFRPGDVFDPHTMMRDGEGYRAFAPARARAREKKVAEDLRDQRRAEGEGSRVKICLFPALYSRPERELTGDDYGVGACVTNCLVDCDNFVADEPDTGEGMFSLVVKGVVLV
ncbi:hypothetical protein C8A03DRAFT_31320 [Achaetomium macrosporum]|uniref:Uncharacterized protein n=1 Tax=Achaetomium macrosporum TaxID=79813 RepID=A0AAN7CEJ3_9PEZI|nr:hypothetical protein C8A03DRAFT_31320 [Achaetomium macrosporum]